jgi:hypothetical protein
MISDQGFVVVGTEEHRGGVRPVRAEGLRELHDNYLRSCKGRLPWDPRNKQRNPRNPENPEPEEPKNPGTRGTPVRP